MIRSNYVPDSAIKWHGPVKYDGGNHNCRMILQLEKHDKCRIDYCIATWSCAGRSAVPGRPFQTWQFADAERRRSMSVDDLLGID